MTSYQIGFIGVGNMGSRMATRLIEAGHRVAAFDPNSAAGDALAAKGATVARHVAGACTGADFILISLPRPDVLLSVITGDHGLIAGAHAGATVLDFSTVDPSTARRVGELLVADGIRFLDAPVSGGVAGAASGNLVAMVGGPADALEDARPVLDVLASRIVHCGDTGTGQLTKLAHNLLTAINTVALGEVLTASVRAGADLTVLTEVLTAGLAGSKMLDYLPETLFSEERPANFALSLMNKDIGLALQEFATQPMFLGQVTRQLYNTATALGLAGQDSTSVAEVYEQFNGVRLAS